MIIGKFARLGEAVHAATEFDANLAIVYRGKQIVFGDDGISRQHEQRDLHAFVAIHGCCVQVKVVQLETRVESTLLKMAFAVVRSAVVLVLT